MNLYDQRKNEEAVDILTKVTDLLNESGHGKKLVGYFMDWGVDVDGVVAADKVDEVIEIVKAADPGWVEKMRWEKEPWRLAIEISRAREALEAGLVA